MSAVQYDILFSGRVQGVFFRATAREIAEGLEVSGWVRNEPDGTVRCVVEGAEVELDRFVEAVQRAKRGNIEDTRITRGEATGEQKGFIVRY